MDNGTHATSRKRSNFHKLLRRLRPLDCSGNLCSRGRLRSDEFMKKLFFLVLIINTLFLISCQNTTEVKKEDHSAHSNQDSAPKETGSFTSELKTNPEQIKAGEKIDLSFTIKNPKGETVESVQIVHEKPMHLLIVSEDLNEFYHEHPEQQSDKTFKVPFTFKNGGKYKLYADFTPNAAKQVVQNFE